MTRVGCLTLQAPGLSPSQRYRIEAFDASLRTHDIELTQHWVLSRDDLRDFYGPAGPARKGLVAARALGRRLRSLALTASPDVWLVQREAFFLGNHWAEWLASLRAPVVFDFDDAIWIRSTSAANSRYARFKNVDKVSRIVALAHTVIAGNQYLADWAAQRSDRVVVIPTAVDTAVFTPPQPRHSGQVVIGWSGSPSTIDHLRPLLPALERVQQRCGRGVVVRVMGDPSFAYPALGITGETWTPEAELSLLRRMDIGLMPLPDDVWTRGKCGLKGLVSMAMGAATVMSPVGVNTSIVKPGANGFLPATDDEWVDALCRLVDDAALRARIGAAGRETVVRDYSVERWAPALADVLHTAARG